MPWFRRRKQKLEAQRAEQAPAPIEEAPEAEAPEVEAPEPPATTGEEAPKTTTRRRRGSRGGRNRRGPAQTAQAEAKAGDKLLLLDFTGSDWCMWCRRLQAEVFSQPEFEEYAKKNLVLMAVDFPRAKPLTAEVRKQNATLAQKFEIEGFPTIVILNGDGKQVGLLGYVPGGPGAFIHELAKVPKS